MSDIVPTWQTLGFPNRKEYVRASHAQDTINPKHTPGYHYERVDGVYRLVVNPYESYGKMGRPRKDLSEGEAFVKNRQLRTSELMAKKRILYPDALMTPDTFYLTDDLHFIVRKVKNRSPNKVLPYMWELSESENMNEYGDRYYTGRAFPFFRAQQKGILQEVLFRLPPISRAAMVPDEWRMVVPDAADLDLRTAPTLWREYGPWNVPGLSQRAIRHATPLMQKVGWTDLGESRVVHDDPALAAGTPPPL